MSDSNIDNEGTVPEAAVPEVAVPEVTVPAPPAPVFPSAPVTPVTPAEPAIAGPAVAGPAAPAAPAVAAPTLTPEVKGHLLRGLSTAGIAVGGAFVAGLILAIAVVLTAGSSLGDLGLPISVDAFSGIGGFVLIAFTLAGFVFGGEISLQVSTGIGGFGANAGGALWAFPLTLTVAVLVLLLWWSIRQERTAPLRGIRNRLLFSGGVGLATSLVLVILTLIFTIRQGGSGVEIAISSAGFRIVLFGTILVGGTVFLGRVIGARARAGVNWLRAIGDSITVLPRFVREALFYTAGLTFVFGVITVIFGTILLWDQIGAGALPVVIFGLLNLIGIPIIIGHLGGFTLHSGLGSFGGVETMTVFSTSGWSWLLVVVALLFSVVAAVWIGTRRPRKVGLNLVDAWKFPVVIFGAWVLHGLFTFGLTVQGGGSFGSVGGSGTAGLALAVWTPVVFLIWAAAIEFGAQYLPAILYGLSPQVHAFVAGRATVGTWVAAPAAAAGAGVAGVPGSHDLILGGAPQAEGEAAMQAVPPIEPPKPLSPAAKKGLLWSGIGVGAVIVLGIVGAVGVSVLNSTRTADAVALTYLGHIASGNASAANALVDPDVSNAARAHLTDEVLKSATERISDVSVRSIGIDGSDQAYLEVSFKLDGVTQDGTLTAEKGEHEWLVLNTWKISTPLVQNVRIDVDGPGALSIGDVPLDIDESSSYRSTEVALYPAIYEVTSDGDGLYELESSQLQVGAGLVASTYFVFAPTEKLVEEVQQQVNTLLDTCAESTAARSDGCPLRTYVYPSDTPVAWTIISYPTIELTSDGLRFSADGGEATAAYTETSFGSSEDVTDEVSISFYGEVEISDGDVKVTYSY
ncbi:hypothetical protein [Microbacterium sp. A93]|uniref:hypothetical protein n=1 Tax=Microbacterium sp. A93 TaxID=3450716 RepID=UPI003F430201